jgi:tRNA splicing endonuclease
MGEARDEANYVLSKAKRLVKRRAREKGDKAITFEITKTESELEKEKSFTSRKTGHEEDLKTLIKIKKAGIKDLATYKAAARKDESFRSIQDGLQVANFLVYQAVYLQNPRVKFTGPIGKEIEKQRGTWIVEFRQKPKPKPTTTPKKRKHAGVQETEYSPIDKNTIVTNQAALAEAKKKKLSELAKLRLKVRKLESETYDRGYLAYDPTRLGGWVPKLGGSEHEFREQRAKPYQTNWPRVRYVQTRRLTDYLAFEAHFKKKYWEYNTRHPNFEARGYIAPPDPRFEELPGGVEQFYIRADEPEVWNQLVEEVIAYEN